MLRGLPGDNKGITENIDFYFNHDIGLMTLKIINENDIYDLDIASIILALRNW
ncbi:MAG: hypothetical protein F6K09_25910 [Merismopedia sp. SIO2A8]|nr:hypothetical protein [Merismopedia sp. SIO2A8]